MVKIITPDQITLVPDNVDQITSDHGWSSGDHDIDLKKTDKLLKIILFAAIYELLFKHNNSKKVVISEYLQASEFFLEKVQIGYLNAILDKISKVIRKEE